MALGKWFFVLIVLLRYACCNVEVNSIFGCLTYEPTNCFDPNWLTIWCITHRMLISSSIKPNISLCRILWQIEKIANHFSFWNRKRIVFSCSGEWNMNLLWERVYHTFWAESTQKDRFALQKRNNILVSVCKYVRVCVFVCVYIYICVSERYPFVYCTN